MPAAPARAKNCRTADSSRFRRWSAGASRRSSRTIGRKRLKPGPPSAGSCANRKLPRQKRLRATVPSGWASTARAEPAAPPVCGMRLHDHQHVPVRIGEEGARAQRLLRQPDGVKVGLVAVCRRSHRTGMDDVAHGPQIIAKPCHLSQMLRRRWFGAGDRRSWHRRLDLLSRLRL